MEERVKAIMADILLIEGSAIHDQSSMDTIERWDSLAQIELITALEEEFGVTFEVEEFQTMTSFSDIIDILSEKV